VNTGNRILWAVIGLILTLAGAAGLAAGFGWFDQVDPKAPVWPAWWSQWWSEHDRIAQAGLAVLAVLAVIAGLSLLRRQLRVHSEPTIGVLHGDALRDSRGNPADKLTVRARSLSRGVAADLAQHRDVSEASVALAGDPRTPTLYADLEVTPQATVSALVAHVADSTRKLSTTLGAEPNPRVRLSYGSATRTRVS
jgi:hypothetical protein